MINKDVYIYITNDRLFVTILPKMYLRTRNPY